MFGRGMILISQFIQNILRCHCTFRTPCLCSKQVLKQTFLEFFLYLLNEYKQLLCCVFQFEAQGSVLNIIKQNAEEKPVLRMMQCESRAKRKNFRLGERKRYNELISNSGQSATEPTSWQSATEPTPPPLLVCFIFNNRIVINLSSKNLQFLGLSKNS